MVYHGVKFENKKLHHRGVSFQLNVYIEEINLQIYLQQKKIVRGSLYTLRVYMYLCIYGHTIGQTHGVALRHRYISGHFNHPVLGRYVFCILSLEFDAFALNPIAYTPAYLNGKPGLVEQCV